MPGPVDTWNEMLLETIRREFEGHSSWRKNLITCHYYLVHSETLLNIGVHEIAYDVVSPQIGRL
jgi:hypothetical protein